MPRLAIHRPNPDGSWSVVPIDPNTDPAVALTAHRAVGYVGVSIVRTSDAGGIEIPTIVAPRSPHPTPAEIVARYERARDAEPGRIIVAADNLPLALHVAIGLGMADTAYALTRQAVRYARLSGGLTQPDSIG